MRDRAVAARGRLAAQLDKLQWTDVDILSETSAAPYSDFDGDDVVEMREAIVDELKELAGGVAVQH